MLLGFANPEASCSMYFGKEAALLKRLKKAVVGLS